MRIAYICCTSFQVFNVLNILFHQKINKHENINDLFILDHINSVNKLLPLIKRTGFFKTILLIRTKNFYSRKRNLKHYILASKDYIFPKVTFIHMLYRKINISIDDYCKYDIIYSAVIFDKLTSTLKKINPNSKLIMYEDGTGSYANDYMLIHSNKNLAYRLFSRIFKTGMYVTKPEKLYVNNVQLCRAKGFKEILPLPKIDNDFLQLAEKVFGTPDTAMSYKKIIWLTQPDTSKKIIESKNILVKSMKLYKNHIAVRPHPFDTNLSIYNDFTIDKSETMWELFVAQNFMEDKVLMGFFSTAQLTPKILFNKEPFLIFLHHLAFYDSDIKVSVDKQISDFKKLYLNQKRILIPRTINELIDIIKMLIN